MFSKKLVRSKLIGFINNQKPCHIFMEACSGAHYWAKKFQQFGHEVKLINAQFVKSYLKSNKNDWRDAEAIVEAGTRPTMRFVPIKGVEQLDMQGLHRVRQLLVQQRTALSNQIRGLLAEYGIILPQGISAISSQLPTIIEDAENDLTMNSRQLFDELYVHFKELSKKIKRYDKQLLIFSKNNEVCQKLMAIEGVGPKTATIIAATVTNPSLFKNGRELAAWLGLVPRQYSSGGKNNLLGISKRGDKYIRWLLIHGARSALQAWKRKGAQSPRALWALQKSKQIGHNKASVALANKMARIIWAILAKDTVYKADFQPQGIN